MEDERIRLYFYSYPEDRQAIETIKKRHGQEDVSAAIRFALRLVASSKVQIATSNQPKKKATRKRPA